MTIKELEENLKKLKLSYRNYNLKSEYIEDGICIRKNNDFWEVYYCERGKKNTLGMFYNENDACEFFMCLYKKESDAERWF